MTQSHFRWYTVCTEKANSYPNPTAMVNPLEGVPAVLPILQGGKRPEELEMYRECCKSSDFMLIVANWVDSHPGGLSAGARQFREAVDAPVR